MRNALHPTKIIFIPLKYECDLLIFIVLNKHESLRCGVHIHMRNKLVSDGVWWEMVTYPNCSLLLVDGITYWKRLPNSSTPARHSFSSGRDTRTTRSSVPARSSNKRIKPVRCWRQSLTRTSPMTKSPSGFRIATYVQELVWDLCNLMSFIGVGLV